MTDEDKDKKENPGRSEDAQDPDREGGLGAPDEPPGQEDKEPPAPEQLPS